MKGIQIATNEGYHSLVIGLNGKDTDTIRSGYVLIMPLHQINDENKIVVGYLTESGDFSVPDQTPIVPGDTLLLINDDIISQLESSTGQSLGLITEIRHKDHQIIILYQEDNDDLIEVMQNIEKTCLENLARTKLAIESLTDRIKPSDN